MKKRKSNRNNPKKRKSNRRKTYRRKTYRRKSKQKGGNEFPHIENVHSFYTSEAKSARDIEYNKKDKAKYIIMIGGDANGPIFKVMIGKKKLLSWDWISTLIGARFDEGAPAAAWDFNKIVLNHFDMENKECQLIFYNAAGEAVSPRLNVNSDPEVFDTLGYVFDRLAKHGIEFERQ